MMTVHLTDDEIEAICRAPGLHVLALKLKAIKHGAQPGFSNLVEREAILEAHSISYGVCGDKNCDHLHLLLYNARHEPIASASCNREMVVSMLEMLTFGRHR